MVGVQRIGGLAAATFNRFGQALPILIVVEVAFFATAARFVPHDPAVQAVVLVHLYIGIAIVQ